MGLMLASCTSSGDPDLDLDASGSKAASMTAPTPDAPTAVTKTVTAVGEGKAELPPEVAYLPASNPSSAGARQAARAEDAERPPAQDTGATRQGDKPIVPTSTGKSFGGFLFGKAASADLRKPVLHEEPVKKLANETAAKAFIENIPPKQVFENRPGKPVIDLDQAGGKRPLALASIGGENGDGLPGVRRMSALFEITRKSGIDDDSDVDVHEEDGDGAYQVASAAGMARLAPNGLLKQTASVDVACLKPSLVRVLKVVEQRYGKKLMVTSGYRSRARNILARGAKNSLHMYCAAADIQVPGVGKTELAHFLRSMPGRGGVGTYCHTNSVHVDIGPERDWNWRCRG